MHGAYHSCARELQTLTCSPLTPLPHHVPSFAGVAVEEQVNLNLPTGFGNVVLLLFIFVA